MEGAQQARSTVVRRVALLLVLGVGLILRVYKLDTPLMWCDEAESSINALTILEHGVPTDTYLGLPIYENCLTEPWPGNPEYEFRDSSYSKRGVAVYHGWLPLYSMAGSLKLFGIEPDRADDDFRARHSDVAIHRRTFAARLPAVAFGMLFLVLLYMTAREMFGRDAAFAALLAAALAVPLVNVARQARYYSLTLALCTACCLLAWRIYTRGRWRDFALCGLCLGLLFHTHILTCLIACLALATLLPALIMRCRRSSTEMLPLIGRFSLLGVIFVGLVAPWVVLSGFLETASNVPKARDGLNFPADLLMYPIERWPVTVVLSLGTAWVIASHALRDRLPRRLTESFREHRHAFYFLAGWGLIGFLVFVLLIPAASLFFQRAYLGIVGPGIVFGAMLFAAGARAIGPRYSVPIATVLFVGFVVKNVRTDYPWNHGVGWRGGMLSMIDQMRQWNPRPGTRLYSTPNDHLTLTYYTGLPIQSIAPVRREFLERYSGDIVFIECIPRLIPLWPDKARELAAAGGIRVGPALARAWARQLSVRGTSAYLLEQLGRPPEDPSPLATYSRQAQVELTRWYTAGPDNPTGINPAVYRGFELPDYSWWWQIFFYRFIDPQQRMGQHLNYRTRMQNAEITVMPSLWAVYRSAGSQSDPSATPMTSMGAE